MASFAGRFDCSRRGRREGVEQRANHVIAAGEHDHIDQSLLAEIACRGPIKLIFDMELGRDLQRELLGDLLFLV